MPLRHFSAPHPTQYFTPNIGKRKGLRSPPSHPLMKGPHLHRSQIPQTFGGLKKILGLPKSCMGFCFCFSFKYYNSSTHHSVNKSLCSTVINRTLIIIISLLCTCQFLPDTIVTGPRISTNFCLVKFLIRHFIKVLFPTFGGPTTTTTTGGGSNGVRSTTGM